jgi:hypothetical protein
VAYLGWFDGELRPDAWFDAELQAAGWWDTEIIDTATGGAGDATATSVNAGYTYSASVSTPVISATAPAAFSAYTYSASSSAPTVSVNATAPTAWADYTYAAASSTPTTAASTTAPTVFGSYAYAGFPGSPVIDATVSAGFAGYTYSASSLAPSVSGSVSAPSVFADFMFTAFSLQPVADAPAEIDEGGGWGWRGYDLPRKNCRAPWSIPEPIKYQAWGSIPVIEKITEVIAPVVFATFTLRAVAHKPRCTGYQSSSGKSAGLIRSKPIYDMLIRSQ